MQCHDSHVDLQFYWSRKANAKQMWLTAVFLTTNSMKWIIGSEINSISFWNFAMRQLKWNDIGEKKSKVLNHFIELCTYLLFRVVIFLSCVILFWLSSTMPQNCWGRNQSLLSSSFNHVEMKNFYENLVFHYSCQNQLEYAIVLSHSKFFGMEAVFQNKWKSPLSCH